jgi:hypothetical protein
MFRPKVCAQRNDPGKPEPDQPYDGGAYTALLCVIFPKTIQKIIEAVPKLQFLEQLP